MSKLKLGGYIKEKYPFIPIKTEEDAELVKESEGYDKLWFIKISPEYWIYLEKFLNVSFDSEHEQYNFYLNGSEGSFNMFKDEIHIHIWLWVDEEPDINHDLLQMFKKSHHRFIHQGLVKAIDPNYGGLWNKNTKEAASIIIYG